MTTHDEIRAAKELLKSDRPLLSDHDKEKALGVLLKVADALLNAGECFPPKKEGVPLELVLGQSASFVCGYNTRADEDTAILAKRILGLVGVIREKLKFTPNSEQLSGYLAVAITEHILKGER